MKFVEGPKTIRIKRNSGTVILLAGVQGSGKSFFAQNHFDKNCIIDNDKIFIRTFKSSGFSNVFSDEDFDEIYHRTQLTVSSMLEGYRKIRPYTVMDSIGYKFNQWAKLIDDLREDYSNIIILILQPSIQVVKKQFEEREKNKNLIPGLFSPDLGHIFFSWHILEKAIRDKTAGKDADITYIIRNPKKVNIVIE